MSHRVVHTVVFADGPGGGNPCPVVFDADALTTERMQALAAGFGHETVFVLAPEQGGDLRLRYFVPRHEMEMCVHATVAACVLTGAAAVETPLGLRRVDVDAGERTAMVEQSAPTVGAPVEDVEAVTEVLGAAPTGPVVPVSTARAKLMVPVADEATLDGLRPDFERLWALCDELDVTGFYAFTPAAEGADAARSGRCSRARTRRRAGGRGPSPRAGRWAGPRSSAPTPALKAAGWLPRASAGRWRSQIRNESPPAASERGRRVRHWE